MHEGYTNFETWTIALALDNYRELYDLSRAIARLAEKDTKKAPQVLSGIWTRKEAARYLLADTLKEYFEIRAEDYFDLPAPFADLLSGALSSVNWGEIAQELLEGKE